MPAKKNTTFQQAGERGLLDQPRADGALDSDDEPIMERKPLHERRRILARIGREESSKQSKNRERSDDIDKKDLVDAEDIAAGDQARAEEMGRGRDRTRRNRTPSPKGKKSGITLSLKKRKRGDSIVDEENTASPEPMEDTFPLLSSLASLPPPTKKQKPAGKEQDLLLHVKIVDTGLSALDAASLALPREFDLRVPRRSTNEQLVPLLEAELLDEGQQEGRSLRSGKKGMGGRGWKWEIWVWDGQGGG